MAYASVADDACVVAPRSNPYWSQWESFFLEHGFSTSEHSWCGMGIKDYDTAKPLNHNTRITAKQRFHHNLAVVGIPSLMYENFEWEEELTRSQKEKVHLIKRLSASGPLSFSAC